VPVIRPLPEDVASRIAAGEVIERPASVLKELLENSLDAGASKIVVEIEGAGRKKLRVVDDGCGMEPADCRAAFERHSTSKIKKLDDLDKLSTFGFRGEALFSIAAVSKITLTSRKKKSGQAWAVSVSGGKLKKDHEAPPVAGTAIEVRDLFFNTPARAKFLKSDASERGHLARAFEEAALANPRVSFEFKSETRVTMRFPARKEKKDLDASRERAAEVLGEERGDALLDAERSSGTLKLRGFLSPVDKLHSTRQLQYLFVNRRPVSNRTLQQALYRAYEPFRQKNRHPVAVLFVETPSASLDVNVHPTKREVRFRNDSDVFQTVTKAFSKSLLGSKGIPTLTSEPFAFSSAGRGRIPTPRGDDAREAIAAYKAGADSPVERQPVWPRKAETPEPEPRDGRPWFDETLRYLGQIERAYLVFEASGGILLVDQHAAQERVLFEKYYSEIETGSVSEQKLMLPLPIELPASGIQRVLDKEDRLKRAGFSVEAFGKTTLHVTSVPAVLHKAGEIEDAVHRLLDGLTEPKKATADARYDATATIACKASVKAHDRLSEREALRLVEDLRRCEDATCCPHGRPSMLSLDREELARRFKRPGAPPL
jgi:DNA mismatch repair protein MutL